MSKNYVNNKELLETLIEFRKNRETNPECPIPTYFGSCVMSISERLSNKHNFRNYPFKEDMIADGIENAVQAVYNFDPEKSQNPFAYFTTVIYYAFLRRIEKEKRQLYTKHKLLENTLIHDGMADGELAKMANDTTDLYSDATNTFVQDYEEKLNKK